MREHLETPCILNPARKLAFDCFTLSLHASFGQEITENEFSTLWLAKAQAHANVHADGWYVPPAQGISVLSSNENNSERIAFRSLREKEFWPSDRLLVWKDALLFFYCSPVCKLSGRIADFAITLYFGDNERIRAHFQNAYRATQEVVSTIKPNASSQETFLHANKVFHEHGLENKTISHTDQGRLDLGHSFPSIEERFASLNDEQKSRLSLSRKFINDATDWQLCEEEQFSIEPQLTSLDDPSLPKVCLHLLCSLQGGELRVQADVQDSLQDYALV